MSSSEKLKVILQTKEIQCSEKIIKLRKYMKSLKIINVMTSLLSIRISASIATTFLLTMAISVLSVCSIVLTGVNLRFKFRDKTFEIRQLIDKLSKIENKLQYINSSNGNLTDDEYQDIFKEFIRIECIRII